MIAIKISVYQKNLRVPNVYELGLPLWSSGLDSVLPIQGAQVPSLVREPDPTCCNQEFACPKDPAKKTEDPVYHKTLHIKIIKQRKKKYRLAGSTPE